MPHRAGEAGKEAGAGAAAAAYLPPLRSSDQAAALARDRTKRYEPNAGSNNTIYSMTQGEQEATRSTVDHLMMYT